MQYTKLNGIFGKIAFGNIQQGCVFKAVAKRATPKAGILFRKVKILRGRVKYDNIFWEFIFKINRAGCQKVMVPGCNCDSSFWYLFQHGNNL